MFKSEHALFFIVVTAALVLTAVIMVLVSGEAEQQVGEKPTAVAERPQPDAGPGQQAPVQETATPGGETAQQEPVREDLKFAATFLSGGVVDRKTGEPIREYQFELQRLADDKWIDTAGGTVRDNEGKFHISLDAGGKHRLTLKARRYIPLRRFEVDVPLEAGLDGLIFELDPGLGITGRVVDDVTGEPVGDALVGPVSYTAYGHYAQALFGKESEWNHEVTDERGRFNLRALTGDYKTIAAMHPAYSEGIATMDFKRIEEIEIRLKTGARIFGNAFDDQGSPASGLVISMTGASTPVARAVLTLPDGSFELPPTNPGMLDVTAEPPPDVTDEAFGFTKEKKSVELANQDVEVYFGPSPDHVTWRGRLYDCDGNLVPEARLTVSPVRPVFNIYSDNDASRSLTCNEGGQFEVRKLLPGEYAVVLRLSGRAAKMDWNTVSFDMPGIIEKDIHVLGGVIKGTVVDASTGKPLIGKGGYISGNPRLPGFRWFSSSIDENARFVLQGLPPAKYQLDARVPGYPPAVKSIEIKENERIENYTYPLAPGGKFVLKFTGFLKTDPRECEISWKRDGGQGWFSKFRIDDSGEKEVSYELETGKWALVVKFEGWGTVEREFEIHTGKTAEVVIDRSDVAPKSGTVNAVIHLTWTDGTPAADVEVRFFAHGSTRDRAEEDYIYGTTDPAGRVDLMDFVPGEWRIMAGMPDGGHAELPRIEIPEGVPVPFVINLVLPLSEISGTLHDGVTGQPFGGTEPRWWIHLFDVQLGDYITSIQSGKGSRFRFFGIKGGEYKLTLNARGYAKLKTGIFNLAEGQSLDLGRIEMEPTGVLDLEVFDASGNPIPYHQYELNCPGHQLDPGSWAPSPGRHRHAGFPLGIATVKISAKGFRDKEFEVRFDPGKPARMRIVLEKE